MAWRYKHRWGRMCTLSYWVGCLWCQLSWSSNLLSLTHIVASCSISYWEAATVSACDCGFAVSPLSSCLTRFTSRSWKLCFQGHPHDIFPVCWPFYYELSLFVSSSTHLEGYSYINPASVSILCLLFAWRIFFQTLTFNLSVSLYFKCVL